MLRTRYHAPLRPAVVGAGASGTLVAIHLLEAAVRQGMPLELTLVDPDEETGRGLAYGSRDRRHLLNVPAGGMSCFPDDPHHFVRWLADRGTAATVTSFVPRSLYGDYLAGTLKASAARAGTLLTLRRIHAHATDCSWSDGHARLGLSDGSSVTADHVVLATGSPSSDSSWAPAPLRTSPRFTAAPWAPGTLDHLRALDGDVLLVGTGLTAMDIALSLARPGRVIHALSRQGRLPQPHAAPSLPPVAPEESWSDLPLRRLRAKVHAHIRQVTAAQGDWRPALDGLRPLTNSLWAALPEPDRAEFLRDSLSLWNTHRHRMAPETAEAVSRIRRSGRLSLLKGEILAAAPTPDALTITLDGARSLRVAAVVDCTGPALRLQDGQNPLLDHMLSSGLIAPGPLGLGLACTAEGRLIPRNEPARPLRSLWTLGPTRRGELWESTAIPEIRRQAAALAQGLMSRATASDPAR
ncbi:FAD/NAD(P)-binding protein [Streptomyces sp. NRRL WC-3618]|uniref:FAD/NAD(P)-binding protein n=1 Tax=Streptomyces sp. NRRL WC-3618 TaxID=1519490 RepID=UPI00131E9687|nr:FAD/NAD(P)-binding protein [Streptomyces sp. NRRL WC-3618]